MGAGSPGQGEGPGVVVVGGGQSAVQLVDSLRDLGYAGPLALVAAEGGRPYQRPPLSKEVLSPGGGLPQSLPLRGPDFFAERDVQVRAPARVTGIDRGARQVVLDDGSELPYRSLVLATGARNRALTVPGADLDGVCSLRTLDDALALWERAGAAGQAVVVGAGFIGLEVACALRAHGCAVTILDIEPLPLARAVSRDTAQYVAAAHTREGSRLLLGVGVARLVGAAGRVQAVETTDGRTLAADLVVVGVGVSPEADLAEAAGLLVEDGIVVDETLRTSDPAIHALGDCARFPSRYARGCTRIESVQNATDQARHLAGVLLGRPAAYDAVPWFWSHQGRLRLQIAGLKHAGMDTVLRGDPASGRFSVFGYLDGSLVVVESVNSPAEHLAARRVLGAGLPVPASLAADPTFDLKSYSKGPATPGAAG